MPRYFIELAYKGTAYSGFQVQQNANSVQAEVEKALKIYYRQEFVLTCSSRTDAGVHARQNYFHFDSETLLTEGVYHLNAILPGDISVCRIFVVDQLAHCRFDAISREYHYYLYFRKDPFIDDRAFYYPYPFDSGLLDEAAKEILQYEDFSAFSKRNTQVKSFLCNIYESQWVKEGELLVYRVRANRFLRGMVKGLVGTMLQVGRGKVSLVEFRELIKAGDPARVDFSVPSQGLFLNKVEF